MLAGTNSANGFGTIKAGTEVFLVRRDGEVLSGWGDYSSADKECRLLNCDRQEWEAFAVIVRIRISDPATAGV